MIWHNSSQNKHAPISLLRRYKFDLRLLLHGTNEDEKEEEKKKSEFKPGEKTMIVTNEVQIKPMRQLYLEADADHVISFFFRDVYDEPGAQIIQNVRRDLVVMRFCSFHVAFYLITIAFNDSKSL